jgi:hypothetical protein
MWKTDKHNFDTPVEMKECITAEQRQVEAVRKLMDSKPTQTLQRKSITLTRSEEKSRVVFTMRY